MDRFINAYIAFLSWYDPYYQDDEPEEPAAMFYNLQEIKKDLDRCGDSDREIREAKSRVNVLLDTFKEVIET